ncbi:FGGY-family carbohydrate kinase [Rhodospirillaceae bacterium SYSU D60014]|uniref:FGGY-family carbohydrate kinase n=1 Tax=Virgifigura deserti TaxID=2268457 RepID=UPI000E66E496
MAADLLIGLDAGTSVIKAVVFTFDGEQVACASVKNRLAHVPQGGVEQDMDETWAATAKTLRALGDEVPGLADRVAALSITGQGDGTWLIDAEGRPVAPAWLWLDGRAGPIVEELRRNGVGEEVHRITGTGLNPSNQSGQLLWLRRHRPELLARAATAFHCKDWLYFNLTGERATDQSEANFTFGDFRTRDYSDEVLRLFGLAAFRHLLPEQVDGMRHHGRLTAEAARETGLKEGMPVCLAPVDILCTALGAGLYEPERPVGCTILGSTGAHMRLYRSADAVQLKAPVGYTMVMIDAWAGIMSNMSATLNVDWLLDRAEDVLGAFMPGGVSRGDLLALMDRRAAEAEPGRVLFHPFIYEAGERGPFVEPRARAQFLGLTSQVTFFDMMRGVYESLGFAARDCYEALGHAPCEIRLAGGAARSPTCRRILASAVNAPVRLVEREEAGAAGAAMIAAVAIGATPSLEAICKAWVDPFLGALESPDPQLVKAYDALFPIYRQGYQAMFDVWHALHTVRGGQ